MVHILFNKSTLFFYVLVLVSQYLTKAGLVELARKNRTNYILIANIFNCIAVFYVFYYSYKTTWWAFIGLINVAIILISLLNYLIIKQTSLFNLQKSKVQFLLKVISVSLTFFMFFFLD